MNRQALGETRQGRSLIDGFGRRIDYLRVSVTDRCDLRCTYCMPKQFKGFEEPANWLTHAEMARLVGLFVQLGVSKVRITGGEPLMRRGVTELAAQIARMPGLRDLSLSTNGTTLARHAQALKAAGVSRLNVSLDALDAQVVESITGRDCLADVLHGLRVAREQGLSPIKLNCVVHEGTPESQVERLLDFAIEHGFILRLIEAMPMGDTGRNTQYLDLQPIADRLKHKYGLIEHTTPLGAGPARYLGSADGQFNVGFITPISQHFCATCNRVRLSVDGTLYMCLGQEERYEFRPLLRGGASDAEIEAAIREAIELKPERHEFREQPLKLVRFMSMTGG